MERYLQATPFIDSDDPSIRQKAQELTKGVEDPIARAKEIFYFVRDRIKYNVYTPKASPHDFRASTTLARGEGYCVQKAILLTALCRAAGIPARLRFAIIRNHLMPPKLYEIMKSDILPWHGYAEIFLNGRWVKATPAFDLEMCQKQGIIPVEFDGLNDAKFHPRDLYGRPHIEYLKDRGPFDDPPLEEIQRALRERGLIDPA